MENDAYKLCNQANKFNKLQEGTIGQCKENLTKSNFFVVFILFNKHIS